MVEDEDCACRSVTEFVILNKLGEGTYGTVFRAKDRTSGDIVALKKVRIHSTKEGFPITALREVRVLSLLQHPNIVRLLDVVVGDIRSCVAPGAPQKPTDARCSGSSVSAQEAAAGGVVTTREHESQRDGPGEAPTNVYRHKQPVKDCQQTSPQTEGAPAFPAASSSSLQSSSSSSSVSSSSSSSSASSSSVCLDGAHTCAATAIPLHSHHQQQADHLQTRASGTSSTFASSSSVYLVFEYCEHDLAFLVDHGGCFFTQGEVKSLLLSLLRALHHMHSNWVLHRDIKLSNLLLTNKGELKLADFGLARSFQRPHGVYTDSVTTLWYRAPEILLGCRTYGPAVDVWAVGCVLAELLTRAPLLPGHTEQDQMAKIIKLFGAPTSRIWPGCEALPHYSKYVAPRHLTGNYSYSNLHQRLSNIGGNCLDLLKRLLTFNPAKRISAHDAILHPYFQESPAPVHPAWMRTWREHRNYVTRTGGISNPPLAIKLARKSAEPAGGGETGTTVAHSVNRRDGQEMEAVESKGSLSNVIKPRPGRRLKRDELLLAAKKKLRQSSIFG